MDLVSSREHLCYVRCAYCNTVLALQVGVPCKRLMDTVTVKCGHCNHLSFLNPRRLLQAHYSDHQLGFQDPCNDCRKGQLSAASSSSSMEQAPKAPFVVKPPEKKHRLPSAYNRFMREEIQRIKAAKPDIPHREAFSTAAKNWAKCDPRGVNTVNPTSENNEAMKSIMFQHERGNGYAVEAFDVFKQMDRQN
ncbi:protein DROOPING LEAF-like isoform X1 [Phalaenopsis equestris]|uniref:protein DROOPING LEAF-like isoform X1 n=1 Tax=Phalaenopsis equestris TaxID=78828 RepID=UPI0009E6043A|nr:protein DROOPING LEAF-like isoform X1 [Phalaenopsis equestris]